MLQDEYISLRTDQKLKDLVDAIKISEKNIFSVVDSNGKFAGIIELNDIKQKLFQPNQFERISIQSIMKKPSAVLRLDQDMHSVMEKFDLTQSWYLPVLDPENKFLGFISKTKLFNKYREILAAQGGLYDEG